jgi:hypothetical protein
MSLSKVETAQAYLNCFSQTFLTMSISSFVILHTAGSSDGYTPVAQRTALLLDFEPLGLGTRYDINPNFAVARTVLPGLRFCRCATNCTANFVVLPSVGAFERPGPEGVALVHTTCRQSVLFCERCQVTVATVWVPAVRYFPLQWFSVFWRAVTEWLKGYALGTETLRSFQEVYDRIRSVYEHHSDDEESV